MCPEGNTIFTIKKVILLQCFLNFNSGFIDKKSPQLEGKKISISGMCVKTKNVSRSKKLSYDYIHSFWSTYIGFICT